MTDDLVALRCLAEADPAAISASAYRGGLIQAIDALEAQAKRIAELEDAEVHLGNLLARIHRDGGHYQAQHGTFRAVGAAASAWYELVARAEKAEAELAAARDCIRDLAGPLTDFVGDFRHIDAIAAARGEHHKSEKSCKTCVWKTPVQVGAPCVKCHDESNWQPKSDACPTCEGGMVYLKRTTCPDCKGTGKTETK